MRINWEIQHYPSDGTRIHCQLHGSFFQQENYPLSTLLGLSGMPESVGVTYQALCIQSNVGIVELDKMTNRLRHASSSAC